MFFKHYFKCYLKVITLYLVKYSFHTQMFLQTSTLRLLKSLALISTLYQRPQLSPKKIKSRKHYTNNENVKETEQTRNVTTKV